MSSEQELRELETAAIEGGQKLWAEMSKCAYCGEPIEGDPFHDGKFNTYCSDDCRIVNLKLTRKPSWFSKLKYIFK